MSRRVRAQSNVVGVAVLLAITVVAMGALTASLGAVVDDEAAAADAASVAREFERALRPVENTGPHAARVSFTDGTLRTEPRTLRIANASGTVATVAVDALVFEHDDHRVAFVAGAVIQGTAGAARVVREPPIAATRDAGGVLVVGAPSLGADGEAIGGRGRVRALLRTNVSHRRVTLGPGTYRVAVETATPGAWARQFRRLNATVVDTDRDDDGDGVGSVVARFAGNRTAHLVVHDLHLEVTRG